MTQFSELLDYYQNFSDLSFSGSTLLGETEKQYLGFLLGYELESREFEDCIKKLTPVKRIGIRQAIQKILTTEPLLDQALADLKVVRVEDVYLNTAYIDQLQTRLKSLVAYLGRVLQLKVLVNPYDDLNNESGGGGAFIGVSIR